MKKFAAIALALILAMSSMFATIGVAGSSEEAAYDNNELSFGFIIKDNGKGVVVDVESMRIYGLEPLLTVSALKSNYLEADTANRFSMEVQNEAGVALDDEAFIGTGDQIVLIDKDGEKHAFNVIIFGDLTGDSAIDVIDAAQAQRIHTGKVTPTELAVVAGDADKDGEITVDDYASQVNAAVGEDDINQNATGTEDAGIVDVDEQVYVSGDEKDYALTAEDVTLTYNDIEVDSRYFDISDVKYTKVEGTGEIYGEVTITGKGLFHGEITLKIEVVSLLEKVVATVNEVIEDANLANVCTAKYEVVNGVADIKVEVDASDIIRGNFDVNMAGLNGLLTKIDEFKAENLQEATLTVGDLAIATNGDFDRSAIKALVFDIAKGIFCDIANADDNVVKSYSGVLVTNNKIADLAEEFNIDVVMTGTDRDIDRVKAFAAKVSRYVAFDVVDGNAVIDVTMPAGFATKVVDYLSNGTGDVDKAIEKFNAMNIGTAMLDYLANIEPSDISAGSAAEIEQAIEVAIKLVDLANKGLGEVADATVTSNVKTMPLLSNRGFNVKNSTFEGVIEALTLMLSDEVLKSYVGDFYNDGIYTVAADVELDYRNIKETVIVNVDFFGAAETPDIIEETATYFSDIIETLGLANVATVSYDAEKCRALATLDARELATNLTLNETAFDGLYTEIKGYFDDNYGTSTIVVGGKEIVTAGKINKTALKDLIFSAATGFFQDAANLGANNVLRSYNTVVTEADGTKHIFDLDFALAGSQADVERVASIAAKVADYVSFEVVEGNAVVNVGLPAGMRAKVIAKLGGDAAKAQELFNKESVGSALLNYVSNVEPSDISAANANEIQAIIDMIASVDNIINKVLGKVSYATVYDVNGNALPLLSDRGFNVANATFAGVVEAGTLALSDAVLQTGIVNYMNADGTYTVKFDAGLTIGGIKETVIINLDIFGDYEKKTVIEETATYFSDIIETLGLANIAAVSYDAEKGRALATLNARELATNLTLNETAFDGLYTEIKGYFDDNYGTSTIVVGGKEIVTAGEINKSALKDLIFSAATGFFEDASNIGADNVLRSFDTVVTEADGTEYKFDLDFALAGSEEDIARIEKIAAKVANYVSFEVVNGNAVVNVGLPEGMRAKVIAKLGGDAAKAQELFNKESVGSALLNYVSNVEPSDISAANANEIQAIIDMIASVDNIINKVLGKVSYATVYDVNGNALPLLSDRGFNVANATFAGVVEAGTLALSDAVLQTGIVNYMNADGTYTVKFDAGLTIGGIEETVIVNLDIFGDYEKKTAIDKTVDYAEDILADLGVASFANVKYADGKAVATFDATALLNGGLDAINPDAIDGLYSDVRDYFDANYGDSTIKVGDFVLVKDGVINKVAVKDLLFSAATGFFTDLANMDANTIRSYKTVVVDGEGNEEEFVFDFNLGGSEAHIEKLQVIAGKVAELVSFKEVDGNAAVSISLPAGMKNKIVEKFGSEEKAREEINKASVGSLLVTYIGSMETSDISASHASDIEKAIDMVSSVDSLIDKLITKVSVAKVYDTAGNAYDLFSNRGFDVKNSTVAGLAEAAALALGDELLQIPMANFMNKDGTYTVSCNVTVKGITEKVTITMDIF